WLNEGFATYAEWLWSESSGGRAAAAHAREWHARMATRPADLVIADPGLARMFDERVYKRGALALHALRRRIGDERFVALAERHAAADLSAFFTAWLHRPALPDLTADGR